MKLNFRCVVKYLFENYLGEILKRLLTISLLIFAVLSSKNLFSNGRLIQGVILDSANKTPVPGARIYSISTANGTYSSYQGKFRINIDSKSIKLKISSLGYENKIMTVPEGKDSIVVLLPASSIKLSQVSVVGNIDPNIVIKRAIDKKIENQQKLKTFSGLLYTKLSVEAGGSLASSFSSGGGSLTFGFGTGGDQSRKQMFLTETFSNTMIDYDKNVTVSNIIQRRQTANIPANQNLAAMGRFISFYDNRINTMGVSLISPLADDALDSYEYKIIGKSVIDTSYVYIIEVSPATKLYPTFTGTIKIVEGSYNLIEADLRPSDNTKISFVDSLTYREKFEENADGVWYPSFLEIGALGGVDLIKGLSDLNVIFNATSIYSEVKINRPLPDSIYNTERPYRITVDSTADSSNADFWEKNSLRDITPREARMYEITDSIAKLDTAAPQIRNFGYNYLPYLDYNRVGSLSAGASLEIGTGLFTLEATPRYSIGQNRWFGESDLTFNIFANRKLLLQLGGGAYSKIGEQGFDTPYPRLYNSISSVIDRWDYYDYMLVDGAHVFVKLEHGGLKADIDYRSERHFSLDSVEGFSLLKETNFRYNPVVKEGNFQILDGKLQYGNVNLLILSNDFDYEADLNFFLSNLHSEDGGTLGIKGYGGIDGSLTMSFPLLQTGYKPVMMALMLKAGVQTDDSPSQFLFRMPSRLMLINKFGNLYSASSQEFGGAEFYGIHAVVNLTDIWWRFLGLPTYEGRGIDLSIAGSSEQYKANNSISYLRSTGNDFYSEIGFGLSRIPTFISNFIYLSLDARWGVGPLATGRFGWGLSVSLPF